MEHIVVGVDFTPTAEQAAQEAAAIARATGATVHLVTATRKSGTHVVEGGGERWIIDDVDQARSKLEALAGTLGDGLDVRCSVVEGVAGKAVVAEAERIGADLIVVGNRRVTGVARLLGAVAVDIVRHAPCSVYIAKTS